MRIFLVKYVVRGIAAMLPLLLAGAAVASAPNALFAPPVEAQAYSISVTRTSPVVASGVHPADILGAGGLVLVACNDLGLLCTSGTGQTDDITALSYGNDFSQPSLPAVQFSPAAGSTGVTGSAVAKEAGCTPAQAQADVFQSDLKGSNAQDLDGDGAACAGNAGFSLDLAETPTSNEVDALAGDPCGGPDSNCDGILDEPVLLVLSTGSPTLAEISATAADILSANGEPWPQIWAGRAALGLVVGDAIDGLCMAENGNGVWDTGDTLFISLGVGSPSLATLGASAADLLRPAPLRFAHGSAAVGLAAGDNVDALLCNASSASLDVYLPVIDR